MCTNFQTKWENGFCHWNSKNLIMDLESTPPLYHVCQFSVKMDNIWFFDLNLGKLSNYVQYLGSNFVEGDAESWVEVEMNWEEVYGAGWRWVHSLVIPFDDIFKNLSLVVSYTPVMLHSQWRYHHCTRDIPVTRFHLMPFPEVEILVGGARVYTPPPIPYFLYPM